MKGILFAYFVLAVTIVLTISINASDLGKEKKRNTAANIYAGLNSEN